MGGGSSFIVPERQKSLILAEGVPPKKSVVFVIGAPGTGKENFCSQIADHFDMSYLVVENLLKQQERQIAESSTREIVACLCMAIFNSMQDEFIM